MAKFIRNGNRFTTSYRLPDLIMQVQELKSRYAKVRANFWKRSVTVHLELQPTENSIVYSVTLKTAEGRSTVDVFVTNPKIDVVWKGNKVPHQYRDGSLCLFYPEYNEWNYKDRWADSLIPWISLWLFYFEIWDETGEWLGGGIHHETKGNK